MIGFDDAPEGGIVSNRYASEATFYNFNGGNMYANLSCAQVNGQNQPCPGQIGKVAGAVPRDQNVIFRFTQPSTVTRFTILGNDHLFGEIFARLGFNHDGANYSWIPIVSNGRNAVGLGNPVYINISAFLCGGTPCDKINTIAVYNIFDSLGVAYDDFQFTQFASPTPTPNPCFPRADGLAPCPPSPTPTPDNTINPPANVTAVPKVGEVEIKWNSNQTPDHPTRPDGWRIYRSNTINGTYTQIGLPHLDHGYLSFFDRSTDLKIGENKFYKIKAFKGTVESTFSNSTSGAPLSACTEAQVQPPPSSVPFIGHRWAGTMKYTPAYYGVEDVTLAGRMLAKSMRTDATYIKRLVENQLIDIPLEAPFLIGYQPMSGDSLQISSSITRCVSSQNGQHRWKIKDSFIFRKKDGKSCEPFGILPCARFYPMSSYEYSSNAKFERIPNLLVAVAQRLHFRENDDTSNVLQLFQDCKTDTNCFSTSYPLLNTALVTMETGRLADGRFDADGTYDTNQSPWRTYWDNIHQTGDISLAGPAPFPNGRVAGCMSCVHDHWRWPGIEPNPGWIFDPQHQPIFVPLGTTPLTSGLDQLDFRPGFPLIGNDYASRKQGMVVPKQGGHLTFSLFKSSETETPMGQTLNNEPIYKPTKINGVTLEPPGGDYVTWYTIESYQVPVEKEGVFVSSDTFHAHGGFFSEVLDRNLDAPVTSVIGTTFFKPTKVNTENVYKNGEINAEFIIDQTQPSLPAGYSFVSVASSSVPVKVKYRTPLPAFFNPYLASGKQDITFQITNPSVDLTNLKVLLLARDDTTQRVGWVDITNGTADPTSRTIVGKFDFTAPGGMNENNERLFRIVRKTGARLTEESSDLGVTGSVTPSPIRSGNNLTYNWTVTNSGPNDDTGVHLMQILPTNTELVSANPGQGKCEEPNQLHELGEVGRVRCELGALVNGASTSVQIVVKVLEFGDASTTGGINHIIESSAYAGGLQKDDNPVNDQAVLSAEALPSLNKPPSAAITSPNNDTVIVSPSVSPISFPITITATDPDGTIASVEIVDNGSIIGTATALGNDAYIFNFNAPFYGSHTIAARAEDNGGRKGASEPINITVNSASTVTIVTPTTPSLIAPGANVGIETRSNIPGGRLKKIELFLNGGLLGTLRNVANTGNMYTHRFTWTNAPRGKYVLKAILTEQSGATTTSPSTVLDVTAPPTISITSPTDGESLSSVSSLSINTTVEDTDGYVGKIEFYANGSLLGTDSNSIVSGTRTFNWQSPYDGIYSIVAVATDDLGISTTSNPVNIGINRRAPAIGELVWIDDAVPQNGTSGGDDGWNWTNINPTSLTGNYAHQSLLKAGLHEHSFENASFKLQANTGEKLSAWVYIDPAFPPAEIMLQWKEGTSWEHRAYWGQNLITDLGTDGSNSRRRVGDIPTGTGWKQLVVPANLVGLEGKLVNGMKFTLHGGRAAWDRVGKILANAPPPPQEQDFVWVDDAPPPGAALDAVHDTWSAGTWIGSNPTPFSGTLAHKHWDTDFNEPYREHSFKNSPVTMQVNPGDTLFTYVYLNPDWQYRPDTLLLQWYDDTNQWTHRAYWGIDSRDIIAQRIYMGSGAKVNTEGWRYMGDIPPVGQWVRLEIPASYVGLEGKNVKGMAFGIYSKSQKGRAVWDYSGKTASAPVTPPLPLKYVSPLWRYTCGSGNSMRFYYTPVKDHIFFDHPDCNTQPQRNSGFIYDYAAPGTVPLHSWRDANNVSYLDTCFACFPAPYIYQGIVANVPTSSVAETTIYKNWSCLNNPMFTSHPNLPDTNPPGIGQCTFQFDTSARVHTRDVSP